MYVLACHKIVKRQKAAIIKRQKAVVKKLQKTVSYSQ